MNRTDKGEIASVPNRARWELGRVKIQTHIDIIEGHRVHRASR